MSEIQERFRLSRGAAGRILTSDLQTKSLRKEKRTQLSAKNIKHRVDFFEAILSGVKRGTIDLAKVFFTDECLFRNGKQVSNKRNACVRVPKTTKKKDARRDLIVESAANSNLRVMVAMGISQMGCAQPYFAPAGIKLTALLTGGWLSSSTSRK